MSNAAGGRSCASTALLLLAFATPSAEAQLRADQVLVVYDSRVFTTSDPSSSGFPSRDVAEYYAGSSRVPGGVGGLPGKRPGVRVLDLATTGAPFVNTPTLTYAQWQTNLRAPLRTWLLANDSRGEIRSIVLCKGISHRIGQSSPFNAGDFPSPAGTSFEGGTYTNCTVDSEMSLLWLDLGGDTTTPGGNFATGLIRNPYWRATLPINTWSTANRRSAKTITQAITSPSTPIGVFWTANQTSTLISPFSTQITPGDIYLVCRLDANTVADVKGIIDRASGLVVDVNTATFVLDEGNSNGVTDTAANGEFDNTGYNNVTYGGDDYEQTRDALIADGRFLASRVRYDAASGSGNFIVGPLINYNNQGLVVSTPVLLLSSYGSNTPGNIPGESPAVGPNCRTTYAQSFNYAPGAIFNTTESYNGRDFGGLGPGSTPQMQCAAFLAAGGTFAVVNAFEPFADTLPDDLQFARNFILGNLSWAEAAYTSLPALSWQQIVIGDPLARVTRTSDDIDGDRRITIEDLYSWSTASPASQDLNRSGTVTDADRKFVEDAVRASRETDMRGSQR